MKSDRSRKFINLCYRLRHCRDATRLWNLIDHMEFTEEEPLYYWVMLAHIRPEFFADPQNLNSIYFTYDCDNDPRYTGI